MFPWFDLLLVGMVLWGGIAGYIAGPKRALLRFTLLATFLLLAAVAAPAIASHFWPSLEPLAVSGYSYLAAPAASMEPWGAVLALQAATDATFPSPLSLTIRLATLTVLLFTLLATRRLLERSRANAFSVGGFSVGLVSGLAGAVLVSTMAPALVLGRLGAVFATAAAESRVASLLAPVVRALARLLAPFVL